MSLSSLIGVVWWVGLAAADRLELIVRESELVIGETAELKLQLVGGAVRGIPAIPAESGLYLSYLGQGQSTVKLNRETTRVVQYSYTLAGVSAGRWMIGPVELEVGGERLVAEPLTITVKDAGGPAEQPIDVLATLSDSSPFLGEVVVYRFRYRHRKRVIDARWTAPHFDGLRDEAQAERTQREYEETLDGVKFSVREVTIPLVATGEGNRTISPTVLTAQIPTDSPSTKVHDPWRDSLFGRLDDVEQRILTADALPLVVRPLPDESPAAYSGLVGRFELRSEADQDRILLGESITQTVVLTGDGTVAGVSLPRPSTEAGMRIYDDAPELSAGVSADGFEAIARFRRAVVPAEAGVFTIEPIELVIFDPEEEGFRTIASEPIEIEVLPGDAGGELVSFVAEGTGSSVATVGEDIAPVPARARVGDRSLRSVLPWVLALGVSGGLAAVIPGLIRRRPRSVGPLRSDFRQRLATLPEEHELRLKMLDEILTGVLSQEVGCAPNLLARKDVAALGAEALALYNDVRAARYGGASTEDLEQRLRTYIEAGP